MSPFSISVGIHQSNYTLLFFSFCCPTFLIFSVDKTNDFKENIFFLFSCSNLKRKTNKTGQDQTLANQGPNSRFDLEAIIKALISKSNINHLYGLSFEDMHLELNAFPDRESNPGPFDLQPTVLTVIPLCFGLFYSNN